MCEIVQLCVCACERLGKFNFGRRYTSCDIFVASGWNKQICQTKWEFFSLFSTDKSRTTRGRATTAQIDRTIRDKYMGTNKRGASHWSGWGAGIRNVKPGRRLDAESDLTASLATMDDKHCGKGDWLATISGSVFWSRGVKWRGRAFSGERVIGMKIQSTHAVDQIPNCIV